MKHTPPNPIDLTPEEIKSLLIEAFGSQYLTQASDAFDLHPKTIKRWLNGKAKPKKPVLTLLQIMTEGVQHIPGAGPEWKHWKFKNGKLFDQQDKNGEHSPGSIRAYWWTRQQLTEYQKRENIQHNEIQETGAKNIVALKTIRSHIGDKLFYGLYKKLEELKKHA